MYKYIMTRRAISVTLETDNVMWLKGRAGAEGESVSELLDQLVTSARSGNRAGPGRSVIGTIDIDDSDPNLERADAAVRAAFEALAWAAYRGSGAGGHVSREITKASWLNCKVPSLIPIRCSFTRRAEAVLAPAPPRSFRGASAGKPFSMCLPR